MTQAPVAEVLVNAGRAQGVRTVDGREFHARVVASNAAATTLFRRLVAARHLPADLLREIDTFRTFSTAFQMNIAAHEPPRYRAFDAAPGAVQVPDVRARRARYRLSGARIRRCQVRLGTPAGRF